MSGMNRGRAASGLNRGERNESRNRFRQKDANLVFDAGEGNLNHRLIDHGTGLPNAGRAVVGGLEIEAIVPMHDAEKAAHADIQQADCGGQKSVFHTRDRSTITTLTMASMRTFNSQRFRVWFRVDESARWAEREHRRGKAATTPAPRPAVASGCFRLERV